MNINDKTLKAGERAIYTLRQLYESFGYSQYKMSKFEEYDLYVRNKSFLVSDHIITFTDTDGKLMALKPDVTLSIVKNSREKVGGVRKLYYNENVYRVPRGALSFKEIMQAGLECIGEIDAYYMLEVLSLASKSLELISPDYVLDISHVGIISSLIDEIGLSSAGRQKIFDCVGEKNIHEIDAVCSMDGKNSDAANKLKQLIVIGNDCNAMLDLLAGSNCESDARELCQLISLLKNKYDERIRLDFSVVDDSSYYSGVVFKGFINGIPSAVLSGGRYDNLMKKLGKDTGALGFAVYLDLIDELENGYDDYDTDVVIIYKDGADLSSLYSLADSLRESGKRVTVRKTMPKRLKYKELIEFN
jgi:ATP phosphoribosyltransferase regulatory subunit